MLRFRPDRLFIGLSPDHLSWVRLAPQRLTSSSSLPVIIDSNIVSLNRPSEDSTGETTCLQVLRQELEPLSGQRTDAHIIVSDRLTRAFIAERPAGARNVGEIKGVAQYAFEEIFGTSASEWEIRIDMPPTASRQLGCALRKTLVSEILSICDEAQTSVRSIQPFSVSEFNRWHDRLSSQDGWFAVFEEHSMWVAYFEKANWMSVNHYTAWKDIAEEFPQWMEEEFLRAPVLDPIRPVWLTGILPKISQPSGSALNPMQVLGAPLWPGQSAAWSASHRLALSPLWPA